MCCQVQIFPGAPAPPQGAGAQKRAGPSEPLSLNFSALRRAARHGKLLGLDEPFLYKVVDTVAHENLSAYPELAEKADYIKKVIHNEEEAFDKTIGKGLELLMQLIDKASTDEIKTLSGEDVFRLYDNYGFPVDLTQDIVAEKGFTVDVEGFEAYMKEQKTRSRENYLAKGGSSWDSEQLELPEAESRFVGYETLACTAKVEGLLVGGKPADVATEGEEVLVVLNETPFYTESGGQVSDTGVIRGGKGEVRVTAMKKMPGGQIVHHGFVSEGTLEAGETVSAEVDAGRRKAIMRNHTAAHLLQAALRQVLGDHVHQAGQLVDEHAVRFDFTHFEPVSPVQMAEIERRINEKIMECLPVTTTEEDLETARKEGAMALFSEKYGDRVRVVKVAGYSMELCGGTHVRSTGELGLFKVVSEASVAAGVRRIEAVTGFGVIGMLDSLNGTLHEAAAAVKSTPAELPHRLAQMVAEMKDNAREIVMLNGRLAEGQIERMRQNVRRVNGVAVFAMSAPGTAVENLRTMGDKLRDLFPCSCVLFSGGPKEKPMFLCMAGPEAVKKGLHAGKIIKEVCGLTGGKGGGRPDTAQGGIGDPFKVDEAMALLDGLVEKAVQA